jgi:cobalt-zinc-cadmium efflux system protein
MHAHAPDHDHSHHHDQQHFWLAFLVTLGFAGVEALAGVFSHSLALLGDAGHMATDSVALGLAALAGWVAGQPASERHSYGLGRVEVMAALANTLLMFVIVAGLVIAAVGRLAHPPAVQAPLVMLMGALGLAVNFAIYKVLEGGHASLNKRATLLHVANDMLASAAAFLAGLVIWRTGWLPIDPILSLFIGLLILLSSLQILGDAAHVLLEGVPRGMDLAGIGRSMAAIEGVGSVHDLHVWSVSSGEVALSAHVVIEDMGRWEAVFLGLKTHLHGSYGIDHITLQPEPLVKAKIAISEISRR